MKTVFKITRIAYPNLERLDFICLHAFWTITAKLIIFKTLWEFFFLFKFLNFIFYKRTTRRCPCHWIFFFLHLILFYFIFKLYNIVLVLPNIEMNLPQVYMCSPSWTLLPPPSPFSILFSNNELSIWLIRSFKLLIDWFVCLFIIAESCGMNNLSFLTRDETLTPCSGRAEP